MIELLVRFCPLFLLKKWESYISLVKNRQFFSSVNHTGKGRIASPYFLIGGKHIKIGDNFVAGPNLRIECLDNFLGVKYQPCLEIGNDVIINHRCHIGVINHIRIGNHVLIGSNVLITDHSHGMSKDVIDVPVFERPLESKGSVIIKDNVWLGDNVSIMPGVNIGKCSIVGANSVITHDIPDYCVAVGSPARVIKKLR